MSNKLKYFSVTLLVGVAIFTVSCKKDKVPTTPIDPNCPDTISFATQILPMMENSCISCHDVGNGTGYVITNHTNISANATAILNTLNGTPQLMPQGGPALHDTLIQQFTCWVNQGKLNN
jgi:hypothetical protein